MNIHELPSLFPAVLDGSCPIGILADAVDDCGFFDLAKDLRRIGVASWNGGNGKFVVALFRKGIGWPAAIRCTNPAWLYNYEKSKTEQMMREVAVDWVTELLV